MSRFFFPLGVLALLFSALAVSAQVRVQPAPPPTTPRPRAVAPDTGVTQQGKTVSPQRQTKRRARTRVYLGVYTVPVEDMSSRAKKRLKIQEDDGVVVVEVMPDSPADEADLRHGDVITHVNGKLVEDEDELSDDLNRLGPGQAVKLSVIRDGKKQEITAKLEEAPDEELHGAGHPDEGFNPHAGQPTASALERLQRIERLERKISRLEKRLTDLEKTRSAQRPE